MYVIMNSAIRLKEKQNQLPFEMTKNGVLFEYIYFLLI